MTQSSTSPARRLQVETVEVAQLSASTRDALWELLAASYEDVTRARFDSDLEGKRHVILTRDAERAGVKGFCTLREYRGVVHGRSYVAVFTGDTVLDHEYHGQTALHREVAAHLLRAKLSNPLTEVFWFLISKGFKTYLLLTRNFPEHWPRHGRATPRWETAVIEDLAGHIDSVAFQPDQGVLRFATPHGRLREGIAPIGPSELAHADVRFFVERNPGHAGGDELCCVGRVDLSFVRHFGGRVLRRALEGRA